MIRDKINELIDVYNECRSKNLENENRESWQYNMGQIDAALTILRIIEQEKYRKNTNIIIRS